MSNFKLKYEDSENIRAGRVSTVIFNVHQIKRRAFFGTPGRMLNFRTAASPNEIFLYQV